MAVGGTKIGQSVDHGRSNDSQTTSPRSQERRSSAGEDSGSYGATLTIQSKAGRSDVKKNRMDRLHPVFSAPIEALFPATSPAGTPALIIANKRRARWHAWKQLIRSLIVMLGTIILLLNRTSLIRIGNAAFFAVILTVLLPATMPVTLLLIASLMLVMGMCIGWAWGSAAMAAAVRARSQVLLASTLQRIGSEAGNSQNLDALYQSAIFAGDFLDWRSTLVYGVFLFVGTFAMGLLRANVPKLALLAIFATVIIDVMLTYGPLFPFTQYLVPTTLLIPTGCYIAMHVAGAILIFPESLNTSFSIDLIDKFLTPVYERISLYSKLLSTPPPSSESSEWIDQHPSWSENAEAITNGLDGILGTMGLMELEISYGRLSAKDLAGLKGRLDELRARAMGLGTLFRSVETAWEHGQQQQSRENVARHQRLKTQIQGIESKHDHSFEKLLPLFEQVSEPLRNSMSEALLGGMEWLTSATHSRWTKLKPDLIESTYQAQKARVAELDSVIEEYRTQRRLELFEPFADFFDLETGKARQELVFSPVSLFHLLSASDMLVSFASSVLALVRDLNELENKRRVNKLWFPTGLRKIGKLAMSRHGNWIGGGAGIGDGENPDRVELRPQDSTTTLVGAEQQKEEEEFHFILQSTEKRDPDARPPTNGLQRVGAQIWAFGRWCKHAETVFAFKFATVGIALWIPQICPSSALFTYTNKGLWAQITAQTFLTIYIGDQVQATIQKIIGTSVGLLWGMVIWYIGNGHGRGNVYGAGAAFFILMIPLMAMRIFIPPAQIQLVMLAGVSVILVVGYSWIDSNLVQVVNAGVGVHVAWRRALLVIIGCVAGFIIMIFPSPQSSRLLVRRTHATCLSEIGRMYMALLSHWIAEDRHDDALPTSTGLLAPEESEHAPDEYNAFAEPVLKEAREVLLATYVKLHGTTEVIHQSTYELSIRGEWPKEEYLALLKAQTVMMQAVGQLGQALIRLPRPWRKMLMRSTAFLHPNLISDVSSTFALLALALREGQALPRATPGPLIDRLLYHDKRLHDLTEKDQELEHVAHTVDGARLGEFELTWPILRDERFGIYASTLLGLSSLLITLDDAERAVKSLVGEVPLPGYDYLLARNRA